MEVIKGVTAMTCSGPLSPAPTQTLSRRRALWGLAALAGAPAALAGEIPLEDLAPPPPEAKPPEPQPAKSESELIAAALRYLKLSRAQLMAVLDTGRQVRRRLAMTSQAQERARKEAEFFAKSNPEEAQRRIAALDGERAQAESELASFAAGRLTRILDRLQIGLAWKLGQGRPPEWTKFDPVLLQPGGFSAGRQYELILSSTIDAAVEGLSLRLAQPQDAFVLEGAEVLGAPTSGLRLIDPAEPTRAGRLFVTQRKSGDGRPFPQRLAEEPDPTVLAPEIQPCAQRLFVSDQLVDVAEAMLAGRIDPPSTRRPAIPAGNPRLVRQHKMEQGLRDQTGHGPELEPQGGALDNGAYVFGAGMGLGSADLGVTDHYCLQFVFRRLAGKGYQKLIDFKDRAVDGGLYTYENQFTFYTLALGGTPIEGEQRLLIQRNRQTRLVQVYVDFRPTFAFVDLDDDAVFKDKKGWFFIDDKSTTNEQGPGAIRWLTVSTGPLFR
jgi:hypothetical protein